MTKKTTLVLGVLAGAVATALIGGIAWAAIPGAGGIVQGCYDTGGNVKVVNALPCPKGFTPFTFLGSAAKATDADKLDGIDSTGFLRTTGTAANSDLLDGIDSTGFMYTAGTGLQLSNGTDFSIDPVFRLPQSCATGDVPAFNRDAPLLWECSEPAGLPASFYKHQLPLLLFVEDISPTYTTVVSLALPAGRWALSSTGRISAFEDGDETVGDCYLGKDVNTSVADFDATAFHEDDDDAAITNLALTHLLDLPSGGTVAVKCRADGNLDSAIAIDFEIVAIAVG